MEIEQRGWEHLESVFRACRVGSATFSRSVQPAEGRSETNSTTTEVYTPQGCQTRATSLQSDTSTWLYKRSMLFRFTLRYDLRRRVLWLGACPVPRGRATQPTLVTARTRAKVGDRPGSYEETRGEVMREVKRYVGNPVTVFRSASGRGSVQDLHMIST
jgi:hypothetical protein